MLQHSKFSRPMYLPVLLCFGLGVALCAAAPKVTNTKAKPAASVPSAPSAASAAPSASAVPSGKPGASITIAAGKRGTWSGKQGNVPTPILAIGSAGNEVFATARNTLFHSSNGGADWSVQAVDFTALSIWSRAPNDVWLSGSKLAHSTDQGKTWSVTSPFPKSALVQSLWGTKSGEFYGVGGTSIVYSKDGGKTFTKQTSGVKGGWLYQVVGSGDEVFVVGKEDKGQQSRSVLLVTKDHGKNWKRLTPPKSDSEFDVLTNLCFSDTGKMFATTSYEVYVSANRGKSWEQIFATDSAEILGFACRGKEIYVAGRGRNFHHSTDEGKSWNHDELVPVLTGKAWSSIQAVHITEQGDVFAGGEGEYTNSSGSLFRLNR